MANEIVRYYACEICGHNHPIGFNGDCRDDTNRFTDQQIDDLHGVQGYVIEEPWNE